MTPEQFRAILAAHGGLIGTELLDTARDEEIDTPSGKIKTGEKVSPTRVRIKYVTKDGTITAYQQDDGMYQILDDPKGLVNKAEAPADAKAPETKTFPDGTERQWDPAKKDWVIIATKQQGPTQSAEAPTVRTLPDGSQVQWNPSTAAWEPFARAKPEAAGTAPGTEAISAAIRPGQTTDLAAVKSQAQMTWDTLTADVAAGRITPEQRQAKWSSYYTATVQPALEQANREAVAEAQRQQQRQTEQDQRARETAARQDRTEERQSTTAERQTKVAEDRLALDTEKASYDRGQDAVSNALKLLQYQVDPSFGPSLAGVYNRIIPGAFQPGSFTTQAPDLDAIAAAHIGPILDMHNTPAAQPGTQGVASAGAPAIPPAFGPRTTPAAAVPPATPATRDQWFR